jgi:hypothetical protein
MARFSGDPALQGAGLADYWGVSFFSTGRRGGKNEQLGTLSSSPELACGGDEKGSVAMTTRTSMLAALLLTASSAAASAADLKDMVGTWRFRDFTIEVRECDSASLCAKVAGGPKNVGKELFASKLVVKGGELFGQIAHPETQEMYNTRFQQKDKDRWQLDGCTAAKVCLTGEFVRVK